MNEDAINDAYALFSSKGYNGKINEFKSLIASNPDALKDSYALFRSNGYNGDINQYSELVGVKKKEPSEASALQSLAGPSASVTSNKVPAAFGEIPKFEGTKEATKADVKFDAETAVKRATGDPLQTFKDLGTIVGGSIAEGIVSANTFVNRAVEAGLLGSSTDYFSSNSAKLLEPLQSKKNELKSAYVGPDSSGKGIVETFQENPSEGAKLLAFEALYQVPQMLALGAIGRSAMIAEGAVGAGLRTGAIISPRTQLVKSVSESVAPMVPLGLSSAGQAYLEAAEKNPEDNWIDTITNLAVGAYKGTSEIASELLFRTSVDDLIRGGFRKGIVSDIAKSTRPTLQAAKQLGRDAAVEGFQEGLEELAVDISSNSLDALIYGEDMLSKKNIYGMADAFILGSAIGSPITLLSKGPSAIGTANDINKRRKISEEVNDLYDVHQDPTTSASEKAVVKGQIINKLAELKQVENNLASFYEEFSEEDRDNVISLNQQLSMAQLIYPELQNEQSKESIQEEVKKLYSDKTKIEVKYDPNIKVYEYDTQKEAGVPSPVVEGEAPIEVQPIEGAGQEAPEAGGVLQVPVEEGAEVTAPTAVTDVVSDFIDRRVSYITPSKESVEGFLYDEGAGKLVIEDDKGNKYDIGNVDDVGGISSADLGVSQAITEDFDISPEGNFVIRGQEYVNQYSNPDAAIQRDSDGNVVSVNLETTQGAKRAFRGPIAETIAYNIALAQKAETINEVESAAIELPTSTVIAAPFFNTTVASISEARNLRKTPEYKKQQRIINRQAKLTGVEVIKIDESIGGFENAKGEKIVEVSNVIQVRGDRANVDNFAAMLGAMSVETQEATIAADYVKSGSENHNADELTFVVSNIDGAIRALKTQGFYDFTINDSASTITVLDFSLGQDIDFQIKIGNLVAQFKLQKIKYEKEKRRALDSRYISPETRKGIFRQLQGAPLQRGQAGSELRNEVSKAIRRNEEIISFLAEGKPTSEAVVEETVVEEDVPEQAVEQEVNEQYDELLENSSEKQVQLGMQQAQINYDIDKQLAESRSWQERERTPMEKYNDLIRIKIQDKLYGVIKLQEDIEYSTGKPVGLDQDFRNAEVLMHGKAANDLAESMDRAEKVVENVKKSGTTLEDFDDLLYALHAQERNRVQRIKNTDIPKSIKDLRVKNDLKPSKVAEFSGIDIKTYNELEAGTAKKGITSEELNNILSVYGMGPDQFYTQYTTNNAGSGMTDVEAQTILSSYGLDPIIPNVKDLKPSLKDAVNGVYGIIADSRERMLDYGLETADTVVAFESMYDNYVPLQGFEGEDSATQIIDGGRSIEIRGRQKRALGRKTKADSPFLTAVAQNQSTIVRARKNEVAQRLYRLAEANPNDQIWKVIDPPVNKEYKKNPTANGIKYVAKNISDYLIKPENFSVRIDGEYKFIQFTDPRMAEMLRGANVVKAEFLAKSLGKFNRFLSSYITTYDPEFVLRNFSRDIQVAVINAISEQEIEGGLLKGKNITTKVVKSVPKSIKAIFSMYKKGASPSNEFEQYYKEFIEDGAKTEWFYSKSVDELRKDIDKLISGKRDTVLGSTKLKAAENFIERINTSVENGVRLAAYMESRKAGLPRDKAAELAKNLTVNFNKSGEWGTVANSLYLFFNASVQGTSRLIRTLKPQFKKNDDGTRSLQVTTAQKIAASMFILGSIMSLLNEALSDDDEDGKSFYSKIPDFEKERNIIIMLPNGKDYFKIPLPYGLNVFYVAGNAMADAGQGLKSVGETVTNIMQAAVGSFSPINFPSSEDFSKWFTKFAAPTAIQIPLAIGFNEDYFGRTIYNENFPTDQSPKPDSELGRKGASMQSDLIAKGLNKITGGSEFRSGLIDINPDSIDFLFGTLSGGAGRTVGRTASAIGSLITGNWDELESNSIPGVRVFYGQPRKFVDLQDYFDKRIEVNQYMEEVRADKITGSEEDRIREMYKTSKSVDGALRNLRKAEKTAENLEDPDRRENRLNEIEKKRYAQIANFQKAYEKYKIDKL